MITFIAMALFFITVVVLPITVVFSGTYGFSREHRAMKKRNRFDSKINKLSLRETINKALGTPPNGCYWEIKYENELKNSFNIVLNSLSGEKYSSAVGINLIDTADNAYYFRQARRRANTCIKNYEEANKAIESHDIEGIYGL